MLGWVMKLIRNIINPAGTEDPPAQQAIPPSVTEPARQEDDFEVAAVIGAALAAYDEQPDEIVAVITAALAAYDQEPGEIVAVIAAALAACGYQTGRIVTIRPVLGQLWKQAARLEAVSARL